MTYLILAQSEITARALGAWLELLAERSVEDPLKDERCIVHQPSAISGQESAVIAYEKVVARIRKAAGDFDGVLPLNEVIVLVDCAEGSRLNPTEDSSWNGLIALLILTFPEIRWVFGVLQAPKTQEEAGRKPKLESDHRVEWDWHKLPSLLTRPRRDPLFDPTGLRKWVRRRAITSQVGVECRHLPNRKSTAAAMDEEESYAYFHGYAAYRFGYRADVVSSWALADHLFGPEKSEGYSPSPHGFRILFEDMSLNFPDRAPRTHLLRLAEHYTDRSGRTLMGRAHHLERV